MFQFLHPCFIIINFCRTRKSKSNKKDKNRRSRPDSSVGLETIEDIAKQYGISEKTILRMQSHSGKLVGDDDLTDDEEDCEEEEDEDDDFDDPRGSHSLGHNTRAL